MTNTTPARAGEMLPEFVLPSSDGSVVDLDSYRGVKNLVLVCAGDEDYPSVARLLENLLEKTKELAFEAAQVVVLTVQLGPVYRRGRWPFPVLVDDGARIHRSLGASDAEGRPSSAVFLTDRFREIYAAWMGPALPGAREILDCLDFINLRWDAAEPNGRLAERVR